MKSRYHYLHAASLSLLLGLGAAACADNPPPEPPPPPPPPAAPEAPPPPPPPPPRGKATSRPHAPGRIGERSRRRPPSRHRPRL